MKVVWGMSLLSMVCLTSFVCREVRANGTEFDSERQQGIEKSFPFIVQNTSDSLDNQELGRKKKMKFSIIELVSIGMLIKSALMPIVVGFLKLLTAKALFVTMAALGLILSITFNSAAAKKVSKTEVINLVGHGHKRALDEIALPVLKVLYSPPWGD